MKEHLETVKNMLDGRLPENIIADAGYGGEENYEYLEDNQLGHYVKYNTFHKENSTKWKADITKTQNFGYIRTVMNISAAIAEHWFSCMSTNAGVIASRASSGYMN